MKTVNDLYSGKHWNFAILLTLTSSNHTSKHLSFMCYKRFVTEESLHGVLCYVLFTRKILSNQLSMRVLDVLKRNCKALSCNTTITGATSLLYKECQFGKSFTPRPIPFLRLYPANSKPCILKTRSTQFGKTPRPSTEGLLIMYYFL